MFIYKCFDGCSGVGGKLEEVGGEVIKRVNSSFCRVYRVFYVRMVFRI